MYHEQHEHQDIPFYCPTSTDSWHIVLDQGTEYEIKVVRTLGRFWDDCILFVNGDERDCNLNWHPCTPFCFSDGLFSWEENGYKFLLVLRGPLLLQPCGKLYLFINGYEAYSRVEYGLFWKKRGKRIFAFGLVFMMLGSLVAFLMMTISDGYLHVDEMFLINVPFLFIGMSYVIAGSCTLIRFYFSAPRSNELGNNTMDYHWSQKIEFV